MLCYGITDMNLGIRFLKSSATYCVIFIFGCATQLAPKYDTSLFKGITDTNVKIMELLASVSNGTDSSTCNERQSSFNAVIGSIDALSLQSLARPMPDNSMIKKANIYLVSRGIGTISSDTAPSARSLEEVSKNLSKMKETDCKSGLTENTVAAFKNAIIISMDQAITYESFLNR